MRGIFGVAVRDGKLRAPWCLVTSQPRIAPGMKVMLVWTASAEMRYGVIDKRADCAADYPMGDVYTFALDVPEMRSRTAFYDPAVVIDRDMIGAAHPRDGTLIAHLDSDGETEIVQRCRGIRTMYYFVTGYPMSSPARWSVAIPLPDHSTPDCAGRFGEALTDTTTIVEEPEDPVPPGTLVVPWGRTVDSLPPSTQWLVLRLDGDKWELARSEVTYHSEPDVCGEPTGGLSAKPKGRDEWLALITGLPELRTGKVESGSIISDTAFRTLQLWGDTAELSFAGKRLVIRADSAGSYRLVMSGEGAPVVLFDTDFQDEGSWGPIWIGDLDRDGKADLILSATRKYSVDIWHLFLSSHRPATGRWWPSAQYWEVGC